MIFQQIPTARRLGSVIAAICLMIPTASAQSPLTEWQITKCRVYAETLEQLTSDGVEGLSASFIEENAAFIERDCVERVPVCPRTQADLDVANVLTIAAMNAGTASSFLPFACAAP